MNSNDYHQWTKDRLVRKIKKLMKRKNFGLVWDDKEEDVATKCREYLPVLEEIADKNIKNDENDLQHIMIEGDNYHALSVLCYTHKKKVDVIYIDPPYNTGNKDWMYNNHYVDADDRFRHSKWLSFMSKRLSLAKRLLSDDGFLIVAIDHHELFYLGAICDEIFGEQNRLGIVTVVHNPEGINLANFFSGNSEFMMVYAKNISCAKFNKIAISQEKKETFDKSDSEGLYRLEPFIRAKGASLRGKKPNFYYPIYVSKDLKEITLEEKKGFHKVLPQKSGKEYTWKRIPQTFKNQNKNGYFVAEENDGNIQIFHKYREQEVIKNVWTDRKYHSEPNGTNLLKRIFGKKIFDYPKSVYLVLDILKLTSKKDSIVLDFFAGSGTMGHAVLELNNEDGGNRQFIICTNDENNNNNESGGIAEAVCYPRIKKVMNGYNRTNGLGGNLHYYRIEFVEQVKTDSDRRNLANKSTEMICFAENTFNKILEQEGCYAVFENATKITGIIYEEDTIDEFNKAIQLLEKPVTVYIFSYNHFCDESDFANIQNLDKVKPIPEVIMNVYRNIHRNIRR